MLVLMPMIPRPQVSVVLEIHDTSEIVSTKENVLCCTIILIQQCRLIAKSLFRENLRERLQIKGPRS